MTTEIAVLNKLGIALATDSAVTISGFPSDKVFDSADKLFELSPVFPVAIMINGNMDCLGVPWEIIIKDFRESEGNKSRTTIKQWREDFLTYVSGYKALSNRQSSTMIAGKVNDLIEEIRSQIYEVLISQENRNGKSRIGNIDQFRAAVKSMFMDMVQQSKEMYADFSVADSLTGFDHKCVCDHYASLSDKHIKRQFMPHQMDDNELREFKICAVNMIVARQMTVHTTGIVIAGYGTEGIFPAIESVEIEGRVLDILKYSTLTAI